MSSRPQFARIASWLFLLLMFTMPSWGGSRDKNQPAPVQGPPDLLMDGGRSLHFERAIHSERDIRGKKGFWSKLVDVIAGEADHPEMARPYAVAVDSHGRVIVTDPGIGGVHIFDPEQHKYRLVERHDAYKDRMLEPQSVAVDSDDTIYVTDSKAGKLFVFGARGKYRRAIGSLKGGEGFFKRPTGIAFDAETEQLYVTDTLRDQVFVLDKKGEVQRTIGQHGTGKGEFHFPTEVLICDGLIAVVDAMNFRVQFFNRQGVFVSAIGEAGDGLGQTFRPKGLAIDSEGHLYMVEGLSGIVQVFDHEGRLLYYFGEHGTRLGQFQLPSGLFIDKHDRIFVVDSYNRRLQVFQYHGASAAASGGSR
jgi:sugar lactone lactonase YvrE